MYQIQIVKGLMVMYTNTCCRIQFNEPHTCSKIWLWVRMIYWFKCYTLIFHNLSCGLYFWCSIKDMFFISRRLFFNVDPSPQTTRVPKLWNTLCSLPSNCSSITLAPSTNALKSQLKILLFKVQAFQQQCSSPCNTHHSKYVLCGMCSVQPSVITVLRPG